MNTQLVSIIIPITHTNEHILETIESARTQTYKHMEILIGNATGDRTTSMMLRAYAKRRKNIRIIKMKPAIDLYTICNALIHKAKGKFIARLDPGIIAIKSRIEKQIQYFTDHAEAVALGGQQKQYKKYSRINSRNLPSNHDDIYALTFVMLSINPSSILVNTAKLPKYFRWYNQSLNQIQEFDFLYRLMKHGKLANLDEVVILNKNTVPEFSFDALRQNIVKQLQVTIHAITKYGLSPTGRTINQLFS